MKLHCDLHSHSTASDGTLTPTELILRAFEKDVEVFALTDHDATEGSLGHGHRYVDACATRFLQTGVLWMLVDCRGRVSIALHCIALVI